MTETNTPSVDRSAYQSALDKLDAAVCDAIAVGQASANRMAAPNWGHATKVFARLCGAGMAMIRAAPLSRWVPRILRTGTLVQWLAMHVAYSMAVSFSST